MVGGKGGAGCARAAPGDCRKSARRAPAHGQIDLAIRKDGGQRLTHAQALRLERERARLHALAARLPRSLPAPLAAERARLERLAERLPAVLARQLGGADERLQRATLRLSLLDPRLVLERGYAWLQDEGGQPVTRAAQTHAGQPLTAILADGKVDLTVRGRPSR